LFGAAFGYCDGTIDLWAFDKCELLIQQHLGDAPVTSISFCASRNGALAFACGNDVCFATLPQWGFGHFSVSKRYQLHTQQVKIVKWNDQDDRIAIISVDCDCMMHIFEVPQDFIPLYHVDDP